MSEAVVRPSPSSFLVRNVALRGVVTSVPQRKVENTDASFLKHFTQKQIDEAAALTGVKVRYWVENSQTTADLCLRAAQELMQRTAWAPETVDALIFVSQTPDYRLPATACALHSKLSLSKHCQAFDVGLGCSGYVYGLWLASALLSVGCSRVLLLAGDTSSRMLDEADRGTALLFGDAGSATALERSANAAPAVFALGTDGAGAANLIVPSGGFRAYEADARMRPDYAPDHLFMDGSEVFAFTLRAVPSLIRETLQAAGKQVQEIDAFLLHQANRFMLQHIAKKVGIAKEQLLVNIDRFGNTSSASIPLLLTSDFWERATGGRTNVLAAGFGVGYSWGAASIELNQLACAETILV